VLPLIPADSAPSDQAAEKWLTAPHGARDKQFDNFWMLLGGKAMTARLLRGADVAKEIREELKLEVARLREIHGVVPGLVTVLVGSNPASESYVRAKQQAAHDLGFYSVQDTQPDSITDEQLLALIDKYNRDDRIHGILVQLPLPRQINEARVLYAVDPKKDVDAFHPVNVGKLVIGNADYLPCTPAGIQELIVRSGVDTAGAEVVVIGRSNIVGKPIANMLLQKAKGANATVTVCHTKTRDMAAHSRRADILIVAAGTPEYVRGHMIKPGAVVIDVGVNEVGRTPEGKRILKGDVAFNEAIEVAGAITPVPGGVGPMTITMLMKNTVRACKVHMAATGNL
jgi:methylenetetrahydrofolate dehydrogenase (NADP+)/methenyltetrahydrofolate cyclohydrolase